MRKTSQAAALAPCTYCHLPIPGAKGGDGSAVGPQYCCYGCRLADLITAQRDDSHTSRWMLTRLGLGIVFTMLVMGFSLPLYTGEVYGPAAERSGNVIQLVSLLKYASLLLTTIVFVLLGMPILSSALERMREGAVTADALVVVGVAAALAYSYVSTYRANGGTYFETTCMVLVLFTLGRYLEALGKARAAQAIQAIDNRLPQKVEVSRGGVRFLLETAELKVGDRVHVPAGQLIPVDGTVHSGSANVDLQSITGESTPVAVSPGDMVCAGALNLDGFIDVLATAVGTESTLGRLTTLLEQARHSKGRYQRAADRTVSIFVPGVVLLSIATAAYYILAGQIETGFLSALAILLISCPCALGIATPVAVWIALGCAARRGVLFKGGAALESLASVRAIGFDKTGTLTTSVPTVVPSYNGAAQTGRTSELLAIASGLARGARHVLSEAIVRYSAGQSVEPVCVASLHVVPGAGIQGRVNDKSVFLGSVPFMQSVSASLDDHLSAEARRIQESGQGLTCLALDSRVEALFAYQEQLRPESVNAMAELRKLGCAVQLLTGDHERRAQQVASQLNIDAIAALTPSRKLEALREMKKRFGHVAMVGDGLNDGPAIAGADVGIAMGCGTDVSRDAADVCLLGNNLSLLPWSIRLCRRALRTIRFNLLWAFAFNAIGIPLAMFGKLSPIFAAAAMVIGSITVVANAGRLERFDGTVP